MQVSNKIGYRIDTESMDLKQIATEMHEYINLFGNYCELKVSENYLKRDWAKKLIWISDIFPELEFSIHLPKNFLNLDEYSIDEISGTLLKLSQFSKSRNIIVHIPHEGELGLEIATYVELLPKIHGFIPENVTILLENGVVNYKCEEYMDFLERLSSEIISNNLYKFKFCLDLGHLFFSMKENESEVLTFLDKSNMFISCIAEIHLHDYDDLKDHKIIGTGKLKLRQVISFIKSNNISCNIVIENTVIHDKNKGIDQIEKIRHLLKGG